MTPLRVVADRWEVIGPLVASGRVLDVGVVDARPRRAAAAERTQALFRAILATNPGAVGVDRDADGAALLAAQGLDVRQADAEADDLGDPNADPGLGYDTIVAGDVIEHVDNVGRCLTNLGRHLAPTGRLVLSTPNPFYARQTWKIWRYGEPSVHEDHTAWFDPRTLGEALRRTGFDVVDGAWVQRRRRAAWKQRFRRYFSHSFVLVAQRRL